MLLAILISVFFIFFPLFLNIEANYKHQEKILYIKLKIFNKIKIFNCKTSIKNNNLILFYGENKKKLISIKSILTKNSIKAFLDINTIRIKSKIEIGINNQENLDYYLYLICANHVLNFLFFKIITNKKNYLKIKNDINIYQNKKLFNFIIETTFLLNFFVIIINLIKILIGKIKNERKKSNKSNNIITYSKSK